jgi:hypothetical protein
LQDKHRQRITVHGNFNSITEGYPGRKSMDTGINVFHIVMNGKQQDMLSLLDPAQVHAGGLPGPAILGALRVPLSEHGKIEADNVLINPEFVHHLHAFLAKVAPTTSGFKKGAMEQGDGWLYIIDRRTPTPGGEVPLEDILGGFKIENGAVVPDSYQRFDEHKIFSRHGIFQLDNVLRPKFVEYLSQLKATE